MVPGLEHLNARGSFTARRPNAPNQFELPPPNPLASGFVHNKFSAFSNATTQSGPTATSLTSVGNLLTPPSNSSSDGLSPTSTGLTSASSTIPPYSATGGGMFPPPASTSSTPYGFHHSGPVQSFGQSRTIFSPSLNSLVRSNPSPAASDSLPPPPPTYESYSSSMSMSAPGLQSLHLQQPLNSSVVGAQTPLSAAATQPSPVTAQDSFRPPPTPAYYSGSQPSSTPHQAIFPYSTGPPSVQQSPVSAGGALSKMSPVSATGAYVSSLHSQPPQYTRTYSYPSHNGAGPVLSNINHPGQPLSLVGGIGGGIMQGFNSGHAAQYNHMYAPAPTNTQNDRPFRCDQCPQSFNRNHDLKRHKRIHLAVKPFPCGHCDKSFSRKDALKRHVLVKGCGKAQATADIKHINRSSSPETKAESIDPSPIVAASA
ncbi:hypothetical protein EJ03DRAFT_283350 [Teratosphaeria nubilosa]|uniref:C2H2-type domain-containing protein n=1 Tax=Teratosphaeria nubilosa TaxID=161662 RepID=A0A6G1KUH7_9PEZI|nr:hypothetical protein EJ03DRAFT_283350 [Teratosphaeria nubilosa]